MLEIAGGIILAFVILAVLGGLLSLFGSVIGELIGGLFDGIRALTPTGRADAKRLRDHGARRRSTRNDYSDSDD